MGFLLACVNNQWPVAGYERLAHPSQVAAHEAVASAAGFSPSQVPVTMDGCGVAAFALPLRTIASMYAVLKRSDPDQYSAMLKHPDLVSGVGQRDFRIMQAVRSCVAKFGSEAVEAICLPDQNLGIAVRIEDGTRTRTWPCHRRGPKAVSHRTRSRFLGGFRGADHATSWTGRRSGNSAAAGCHASFRVNRVSTVPDETYNQPQQLLVALSVCASAQRQEPFPFRVGEVDRPASLHDPLGRADARTPHARRGLSTGLAEVRLLISSPLDTRRRHAVAAKSVVEVGVY